MPRLRLALAVLLATAAPAAAELPPEIVEVTDQAMADCQDMGGTPSVLPAFDTRLDLNGDGIADHVINFAGLQCAEAWSAFCGSAGCPVAAWLSRADGSFARFDFGHLQAIEVADVVDGLPVLRATQHGAFCGDERPGAEICTRLWTFETDAPATPPLEGEAPGLVAAPVSDAGSDAVPEAVTFSDPGEVAPGWTLREVPGSSPLALGGGAGEIAWLAGFCLADQPFLAIRLDPPREAAVATFGFAFSQGPLQVDGLFEPGADGAHVVTLAGSPLPARLAGRDSEVAVTVNGAPSGVLSLSGSTRSLRAALAGCHVF